MSLLIKGATNFLGLTDTPTSYTAQSGKVPVVNTAENALEFATLDPGSLHPLVLLLPPGGVAKFPAYFTSVLRSQKAATINPDRLMGMQGNTSNVVREINLATLKDTALANLPATVRDGYPVGIYQNRYMYSYGDMGTQNFYKYDIFDNSWAAVASLNPGYTFDSLSALVYDTLTDKIYAVGIQKGGASVGTAVYDCAGNTWTDLADAPQLIVPYSAVIVGDNIYVPHYNNPGAGANAGFGKYSIAGDSWQTLTDYGANTGNLHGTIVASTLDPDKLYLTQGKTGVVGQECYRYTIAGNSWTDLGLCTPAVNMHVTVLGFYGSPVPHLIIMKYDGAEFFMFRIP